MVRVRSYVKRDGTRVTQHTRKRPMVLPKVFNFHQMDDMDDFIQEYIEDFYDKEVPLREISTPPWELKEAVVSYVRKRNNSIPENRILRYLAEQRAFARGG